MSATDPSNAPAAAREAAFQQEVNENLRRNYLAHHPRQENQRYKQTGQPEHDHDGNRDGFAQVEVVLQQV